MFKFTPGLTGLDAQCEQAAAVLRYGKQAVEADALLVQAEEALRLDAAKQALRIAQQKLAQQKQQQASAGRVTQSSIQRSQQGAAPAITRMNDLPARRGHARIELFRLETPGQATCDHCHKAARWQMRLTSSKALWYACGSHYQDCIDRLQPGSHP